MRIHGCGVAGANKGPGHFRTAISAVLALIIIVSCLIITAGCVRQESGPETEVSQTPFTVAVTIMPQKQFVERIAGDHARVVVLVPPGASPHTHEPAPQQIAEISNAALYVKVGSGIEFERAWMDRIAGINPGMVITDSSEGIRLITGGHEHGETETVLESHNYGPDNMAGTDPHIWLSPLNAKTMVENTYRGLARADPAHEADYRANKDAYQRELDLLTENITRDLYRNGIHRFMVYHPSWAYFSRDFGLEQIPIEQEGKEPTPRGIENLIEQAKASGITVIFASPEFSTRSAEVIADEIGGRVVLVDPLAEDYLSNMRNVSRAFSEGTGEDNE